MWQARTGSTALWTEVTQFAQIPRFDLWKKTWKNRTRLPM